MKKSLRKLIAFCLISLNIIYGIFTVSADTVYTDNVTVITDSSSSDTEIVPFAREVCNGLPYHDMYPKGWGNLYDKNTGETYIEYGQCWQCKNCNYVLVTEGNPTYYYPQIIGKYGGATHYEPVSTNISFVYTTYCGYEGGTSLDGFHFH